jgi:hypothetical protein
MGFWSSVGDFCGRVVQATVSAVKHVASKAFEMAKNAIGWMAEKGEVFVGKVVQVWNSVKMYVKPILKLIQYIPWPPLQAAAKALESAIVFLERLEKTSFAVKFAKAVNWSINAAKNIHEVILNEAERREAEERKEIIQEAQILLQGDDRQVAVMAEIINEFALVQTAIDEAFKKNNIVNFDHYLRLRATQKLVAMVDNSLKKGTMIKDMSEDELFLLNIGHNLVKDNPTLNDTSINRLNALVFKRSGKNLMVFVFEELTISWSKNLSLLEEKWNTINHTLASDVVTLRSLENNVAFNVELGVEEKDTLNRLRMTVPPMQDAQKVLNEEITNMRNYVYASEGLLQVLEESDYVIAREHIGERVPEVGKIIIDCAEHGKKWNQLTEDEQDLIIDFANIFREASKKREQMIAVEVAA